MAKLSLAWTLHFLYDARTHLVRRDFDRDDIAAVQVLVASSERVLEEVTAVRGAEGQRTRPRTLDRKLTCAR